MVKLEPVVLQFPNESDTPATVCLVRALTADDVAYGEALLADPELLLAAVDFFEDAVANTDPLDFNLTWQRLMALLREYEPDPVGDYIAVLGAIDVALWDLAGRQLQLPCHRLAGGLRARRIDCTAGGLLATDEQLDRSAWGLREEFGAVELRLSGDAKRDVPAIHRLRKILGEHAPFMADAGAGYADLEAARQVGQALEQVEAFWYENPLPDGRWAETAQLRDSLGTGLAGGRSLGTLLEVEQALRAGAFDILVADVRHCGGLSAARRLADLAELHGVRMSLHCGSSPLAQLAGAHLAAANWHVGPLQVEPAESPLAQLLEPAPQFDNGFLLVPSGPGLGAHVQEAILEQYEVGLEE
jgi:L-alanine-DL-glutamate epimerase-like enolase superfamily enzyme